MSTGLMRLRLPASAKTWLKVQADTNNRSINMEILGLVTEAMKENPLEVIVHECTSATGDWISVSIGLHGEDFHEGQDRDEAISVAIAKARELGLSAKAVRLVQDNFTH